ncbi:cytochrome P450 2J2-like [Clupea harengus]|uniref:Cytochrome P450 2J2-like n=1 Tax=Clupea harengus TaxID=7950 RepID=A0A8M1KT75_CLUHA|nr:cytochrome P450 2J2-like [Clupea harengus]
MTPTCCITQEHKLDPSTLSTDPNTQTQTHMHKILSAMQLLWLFEGLGFKGVLLIIFVFLLIADYLKNRKPSGYPPGPFPLPFVGNIFSMDAEEPHIYLTKLAEVYGNIFGLRLGRDNIVFLNGYKIIREALVVQGENFVDRPYSPTVARVYAGNRGLFFSNGQTWKKQRRFTVSTLRHFGQGKKTLELAICEECRNLMEEMEGQKGEAFDPTHLNSAVSNIICQMVFGHRFDYSDDTFQRMLHYLSQIVHLEGSIWHQLYEAFPSIMKHLPGRHNDIFSSYRHVTGFLKEELKRHKENFDPADPRDYIDAFLVEITERTHDPDDGFDEANVVLNSLDLFMAGTETTTITLRWALLYLMKYPHIQEKVHAEIDRVIGQSRAPSMDDRPNMPYTDAVIHEVQRLGNIVPLNGLRMAAKDTALGGYFIPKGAAVMPILTSVLYDKSEWETPDEFNPGHFLDSEGKFRRRDAFLPFSAGKRICSGEQLARMELFLFTVSLFQKFRFSALEGEELSLKGIVASGRIPYPFKILTHTRYQ